MTKTEKTRIARQENTLESLGFTQSEAANLRRISMALHNWHERECGIDNGCIERDEVTGRAYWLNSMTMRRSPINDLETGAKKRLTAILEARNSRSSNVLSAYIQGDPRGAALYIIRPSDVPEGLDVDACYSRGIVVF